MKPVIATMALSLICTVSLAKSLDDTVGSRLPGHIAGSALQQRAHVFAGPDRAASPDKRNHGTVGSRLPDFIAGSAPERAAVFNEKSPAEARSEPASFDRLRAGLFDLYGSRN